MSLFNWFTKKDTIAELCENYEKEIADVKCKFDILWKRDSVAISELTESKYDLLTALTQFDEKKWTPEKIQLAEALQYYFGNKVMQAVINNVFLQSYTVDAIVKAIKRANEKVADENK